MIVTEEIQNQLRSFERIILGVILGPKRDDQDENRMQMKSKL